MSRWQWMDDVWNWAYSRNPLATELTATVAAVIWIYVLPAIIATGLVFVFLKG